MVLAAGLGTRLLPLTNKRPKCLMPVMNRPLLGLWLERLAAWGVERAVVNTHHLASMVSAWTGGNTPPGLEVRLSHEPQILGTGGGLVAARPWLGRAPFLLVNADVLATAPAPELAQVQAETGALAVLGVVDEPSINSVALDQAGRLLGFAGDEGLPASARWRTYSGLACLTPEFLDLLPARGFSSLVQGLRAARAQGGLVLGVELGGFWDDLGAAQRLLALHHRLVQDPPAGLEFLVPPRPLVLGPGARVEPGGRVQGMAVLGAGAVVEDGALVSDSLLFPGARAAAGSRVQEAVLGDGFVAQGELSGGAYA